MFAKNAHGASRFRARQQKQHASRSGFAVILLILCSTVAAFLWLMVLTGSLKRIMPHVAAGSIPALGQLMPPRLSDLIAGCIDIGAVWIKADARASAPQGVKSKHIVSFPGLVMALHPGGELVSDAIRSSGRPFCPQGLVDWLDEERRSGRSITFLDVGANIGSCSLVAMHLGHTAIAIEPSADNLELLLTSLALSAVMPASSRLFLVPVAVGATNSTQVLLQPKGMMGASMISPPAGEIDADTMKESLEIAEFGTYNHHSSQVLTSRACIRTVDDVVDAIAQDAQHRQSPAGFFSRFRSSEATEASLPPIVAVKIDVQGHELNALKGMQRVLSSTPSIRRLEVEVWPPMIRMRHGDPSEVYSILSGAGFCITEVSTSGAAVGYERPSLAEVNTVEGWQKATSVAAGLRLTVDTSWERCSSGGSAG